MTTGLIRILTTAAICSLVLAVPAAAEPATPSTETKPLKLKNFTRKPVATSATRTVKKKNGDLAKVAIKRRAKVRAAAAPLVTPDTLTPAAAQAFAAYELARVRVVTAEEADVARQFTGAAVNAAAVVGIDNVQVVSAGEVNDIDRKADSPAAVSLDSLSRDLAGSRNLDLYAPAEPRAESESWFQRMLMVFGGAFAGVAALVRVLLG